MKKYLAILALLFTLVLSGCSNDDIPVEMGCTVRVNPNTVISGFAELNPGELTEIPDLYQLRIHLFVYDLNGNLKYSDIQYSPDYSHYITFKFDIPTGEYRLLTTTDVVKKDGDIEYWNFSNEENLTRLKISETGLVSEQRGILGYASNLISVDTAGKLYEIDVKPAGALIFANVQYMKSIADVVMYQLSTNRNCESLQFTATGEPQTSIESSNSMDWRTVILRVEHLSESYTGLYTYYFSLPVKNATYQWRGITKEDKYRNLGSSYTCSMETGEEFSFILNAKTLESNWEQIDLFGSSNRPISLEEYSFKDIMPMPFVNE